ncbi:hypothetical protein TNCV_1381351 [Trichonephila clavipes]|nr:hypothetical protein TNCV_1381351 [Trichonephila clavipes]
MLLPNLTDKFREVTVDSMGTINHYRTWDRTPCLDGENHDNSYRREDDELDERNAQTNGGRVLYLRTLGYQKDSMVRKKKRASNPRKNIVLTAKEIESSSSPNKISKSHTSKMETVNEIKIKQEKSI